MKLSLSRREEETFTYRILGKETPCFDRIYQSPPTGVQEVDTGLSFIVNACQIRTGYSAERTGGKGRFFIEEKTSEPLDLESGQEIQVKKINGKHFLIRQGKDVPIYIEAEIPLVPYA
jgi:hypothetical protein